MLKRISTLSLVFTAVALMLSTAVQAQFKNHVRGDFIIKGGAGLPFTDGKDYAEIEKEITGTKIETSLPIFAQFSLDYAINHRWDIGLFGGMGMEETTITIGSTVSKVAGNYTVAGARLVWHLWPAARIQWDPYATVGVGMASESFTVTSDDPSINGDNSYFADPETRIIYTARIGTNYWFTPGFGAHVEAGYGISYGSLGLNLRF
jgi:hypothetical protein